MDDDVTLPPHPPATVTGEPAPRPGGALTVDDAHVLPSAHLANLRDIGGRSTADGATVRRGVAFRSAELRSPAIADDPALARLGLRTVVDLRTDAERTAVPDVLPAGARGVHVDVLGAQPHAPAADLTAVLREPARVEAALAALDPAAQMRRTYAELVVGPAARAGYAALARAVAAPDSAPVLYHCTAGKDRTGWATTALLLAAGVAEAGVRDEYLGVNPAVRAMYAPVLDGFAAAGGDPGVLLPLLEVREEYLDVALATLDEHYGSVDAYLHAGLGLTSDEVDALRAALRE